jgi:hypothetical protein
MKITTWHVFADNTDDWYNTLEEATAAYKKACEQNSNVRLYEDVEEVGGDTSTEHYIDGQGEFPL